MLQLSCARAQLEDGQQVRRRRGRWLRAAGSARPHHCRPPTNCCLLRLPCPVHPAPPAARC